MSEHAPVSPSAIERVTACPASVRLSRGLHSPDNVWSLAGTVAHAGLEASLLTGLPPARWVGARFAPDPAPAFNAEMAECITYATEYVRELKRSLGDCTVLVEQRVKPVTAFGALCWGTPDVMVTTPALTVVIDYKHGTSPVDPRTGQLMVYASSALPSGCRSYRNVIVQPRASGAQVKEYNYPRKALMGYIDDLASAAYVVKGEADGQILADPVPGSHCHWCPARQNGPDGSPVCPAHKAKRVDKMREEFRSQPVRATAAGRNPASKK